MTKARPETKIPSGSVTLDTRGLACPIPLLRLARIVRDLLEENRTDHVIILLASDGKTRQTIPSWCADRGITLQELSEENGVFCFKLRLLAQDYTEPVM